jgi:methylglyoxal synthase/DNA-binding transcriptional regulator LsrR (DeoR family)
MKEKMVKFVDEHIPLLAKFQQILTTGTTGWLLKLRYADLSKVDAIKVEAQIELKDRFDVLMEKYDKLCQDLPLSQNLNEEVKNLFVQKLKPLASGPEGDDVQIAKSVLDGTCNKVIFFEDPFWARPHEPDIQLLERTCRLHGEKVVCISDPVSADIWAKSWKDGGVYRDWAPISLTRALEKHLEAMSNHNVYVILARPFSDPDIDKRIREGVCGVAAYYLYALITKMGPDKAAAGKSLRLVIPWGTVMGWLVERLSSIADKKEMKVRFKFITMAMTGLLGSEDPSLEAYRLAEEIAKLFDGEFTPIISPSFVLEKKPLGDHVEEVLKRLPIVDIALLVAHPMREPGTHLGLLAKAPIFEKMFRGVKKDGAIGEMSGLWLKEDGTEVVPIAYENEGTSNETQIKYRRVGLEYRDLQSVASDRERRSILLIGAGKEYVERAAEEYIKVASALFKGRLVSVLITDVVFGRHLLGLNKTG